jgi:hypothetical protein
VSDLIDQLSEINENLERIVDALVSIADLMEESTWFTNTKE